MSAVVSKVTKRRSGFLSAIQSSPLMGPLVALILATIFFATQSDKFLTGANFSLIMQQVMVVGTLAIGQTLVILTGGIDLSNGMIMALSSILITGLTVRSGVNPILAVFIGMAVCVAFGLINGGLVTGIGLPAFIVTLGTYNIAFALIRIYTTSTVTNLPGMLLFLGNTFSIAGTEITYGSVVMIMMFIIAWYILRNRVLLGVYTVAAITYGIAGLLLMSRTGVGDPNAGGTSNLDSITAVVIGGVSLLGGRGHIMGALIGALIVGVFRNGLQLMGIPSIYQTLITGVLVIAAVSVDYLSHRGK